MEHILVHDVNFEQALCTAKSVSVRNVQQVILSTHSIIKVEGLSSDFYYSKLDSDSFSEEMKKKIHSSFSFETDLGGSYITYVEGKDIKKFSVMENPEAIYRKLKEASE